MTQHLLIVTLGPVQEFIKQARRTRDLWFGSHLLSELSRAAARRIAEVDGATLVFPALDRGDRELEPCWTFVRAGEGEAYACRHGLSRYREDRGGGTSPVNVANKIVATLPADADPQVVAREARAAVSALWREVADYVRRRCHDVLAPEVDSAWAEQIDGVLEYVAAWASFPAHGYAAARREVEDVIAGRKHLRDFSAWEHLRGTVLRSSLFEGRETVLAERVVDDDGHRRIGIARGEQLDAVSLCKRAGGNPDQFVPTPNIALARWLDTAARVAPDELEGLRRACVGAGIRRVQRDDSAWRKALPFYADVVLESQYRQVLEEATRPPEDPAQWFGAHVRPVLAHMREPHGYLAALVADGDFMGKAIESLTTSAAHRRLSEALARFSGRAREIVECKHLGELVYAGGDDVLALVCVTDALACAEALRDAFAQELARAVEGHALERPPTLSVGLGIAHRTEGLGDLVGLGQRAEALAKREPQGYPGEARNALAIIVTPRSGQERAWRANWGDEPVARLRKDVEVALPLGKVHAIAEVHRRLRSTSAQALRCEVVRILAHGSDGAPAFSLERVGLTLDPSATPEAIDVEVRRFVDRQLIAEVFARAERQSRGRAEEEVPQ